MKITQRRNEAEGRFKGKKYFEEIHVSSVKTPWFKKIEAPRYFVTTVNRVRANHINVKESLEKKNYVQDNACKCGRIESLRHVLFECEKYVILRDGLYRNLERAKVPYPYDIEEWARNLRIRPLEEVVEFLKKIKSVI